MNRGLFAGFALVWLLPISAWSQVISQRGFIDTRGFLFPQTTSNDVRRLVGDVVVREEVFVKPASWIQFAGGIDARANSHSQVDRRWRIDLRDRGELRPSIALRRVTATLTGGPFTIDVGKQFLRWGKTDIVTPTDHVAPRDFLNVVDTEFLAVTGGRLVAQFGAHTFDLVWLPFFTPSRAPLLSQRWTSVPVSKPPLSLFDASGPLPRGSQAGLRWARTTGRLEYSVSYFDGFNHLPNIDVRSGPPAAEIGIARSYPRLRSYGFDAAIPVPWFTVKLEAAHFTTPTPATDEYVLYAIQLERQTGEWMFVGGYAGEAVTARRAALTFAPDRGLTRSFVARASYTIDANRSAAFETAIRQNGRGAYLKGEYSQARGQHWRATATGAAILGHTDDFLGQYRRNSHITFALRYSF